MRQTLPTITNADHFVRKMASHFSNWNMRYDLDERKMNLQDAIQSVCISSQQHRMPIPEVYGRGLSPHANFEPRFWQLYVDSAIYDTNLSANSFSNVLIAAFDGICSAELGWFKVLLEAKRNITWSSYCPSSIYRAAYNHVQQHSITDGIQTIANQTPKSLIQICCRQHLGGAIAAPLTPVLGGKPIWGAGHGVPLPKKPSRKQSVREDVKKPCILKSEYVVENLKKWDSLRNKRLTIHENLKKGKWQHIVHMDWRSLDESAPDLLVRGKFPPDWKKVSASLVSNEMPHWTYIYNVYPTNGVNRGGRLRVGYILDVPSQNILSTNPQDIASIESEAHMAKCRKHGGGPCDITCYIKDNIRGRRKKPDHRWQYALKDLLTPDGLMNQTRTVRNGVPHQNELIVVNPGGTLKKNTYEGMPAIDQVKVKGIYLIIDDDDSNTKRARDLAWANRIALKNNLPIFKTYRSSNLRKLGSYICEGQPKQGVFFNGLANKDNKVIVKKLSAWESVRKAPVKQGNSKNWHHIVHMDKRVLYNQDPLVIGRKFPGDWKKISASLVSEKTPDWTYKVNGTPIRVGYILDVPPQNILSTDPWNVASIGSESHIRNCRKPHKSGKCHILCYLQAKAKQNNQDIHGLHALQYLLTPEELIMQQRKKNQNGHNELLIIGEGTSNRPLYEGMKRTTEVLVRGIYLVISKADTVYEQRRNLAWAEKASKSNNNLPIFKVHV